MCRRSLAPGVLRLFPWDPAQSPVALSQQHFPCWLVHTFPASALSSKPRAPSPRRPAADAAWKTILPRGSAPHISRPFFARGHKNSGPCLPPHLHVLLPAPCSAFESRYCHIVFSRVRMWFRSAIQGGAASDVWLRSVGHPLEAPQGNAVH